jgi:hypothetical protein
VSSMGVLAVVLSAAGVVAALLGVLAAPRSRPRIQAGLGVMLDLWLAAALLELAGEPRWSTIGTSALLVTLRLLLRASLVHAPA